MCPGSFGRRGRWMVRGTRYGGCSLTVAMRGNRVSLGLRGAHPGARSSRMSLRRAIWRHFGRYLRKRRPAGRPARARTPTARSEGRTQRGAAEGMELIGRCFRCLVQCMARPAERARVLQLLHAHEACCPGGKRAGDVWMPFA